MPSPKRVRVSLEGTAAAGFLSPISSVSNPSPQVHADDTKENLRTDISTRETDQPSVDEDDQATEPHETKTLQYTTPRSSYAAGRGYDALKSFNGQVYKGMTVGGSHTWKYDPGVWKETKLEPDLWDIDFEAVKKRASNAPEGSGVPVGTGYHWLIVAHQYVEKVDANTYKTHLLGSKYKLAHKHASSNTWSVANVQAQRERELELLDDAKRRVQGLPPILANEKVRVKKQEKGQRKLDSLFSKTATSKIDQEGDEKGMKRKRDSVE